MKILMKPRTAAASHDYTTDMSGIAHKIHAGLFLDTFSASRIGYSSKTNGVLQSIKTADSVPATTLEYNTVANNMVDFDIFFSSDDHSGSAWFLNPSLIPDRAYTTSLVAPIFNSSFPASDFIGYAQYGAKYNKIPTYMSRVDNVDVNRFITVGVTWPQSDIVKLSEGIIKYAYFVSYKGTTTSPEARQFVARLDVTDVNGTSTHSSNYEVVLNDVNTANVPSLRIKSFNAKVKYQVKNV